MGGVCYAEIEEIFVKNNNKEAFLDAMNGKLKLSRVTRDKIFNHFLQFSKKAWKVNWLKEVLSSVLPFKSFKGFSFLIDEYWHLLVEKN